MDALSLLRRDHDASKPLPAEIKETSDRAEMGRSELFSRIKAELTVHEMNECMERRKETARDQLSGPSRAGSR